VLVRVHAAAITRGELEWPVDRQPAILSYELSGVVVGSGDEVYALTPFDRDGVAAEYAVVPAEVLAPKPLRLSHVEAAALPMGGLTAWQALFVHGRLARGERVLVTGASGESPVHKQCLPGGQPAHRQSRRLDVAQLQRLRCKHLRRDEGVLGGHAVAIERRQRIDLVTAVDGNARKLERRSRRQSIDRPLQLATRNRRRMHSHQHLARLRRRRLDLLDLQAAIVQPYR